MLYASFISGAYFIIMSARKPQQHPKSLFIAKPPLNARMPRHSCCTVKVAVSDNFHKSFIKIINLSFFLRTDKEAADDRACLILLLNHLQLPLQIVRKSLGDLFHQECDISVVILLFPYNLSLSLMTSMPSPK